MKLPVSSIEAYATPFRTDSDFQMTWPCGSVNLNCSSLVSSSFDPFGAGLSPFAYQTMVLSNQIASKKKF